MEKQVNPVNWFEIPASDLERARKFYESVLGMKLTKEEMGPIKMYLFPGKPEQQGISGSLINAKGFVPSHEGTLIYFSVPDIEDCLAKVNTYGGKTLMTKIKIGEHGYIAQFEDPEGNRVALHSMT